MSLAIVIPVYGVEKYTRTIITQLYQQVRKEDDVFLIDNLGTWKQLKKETVVKSGSNLRWCRGTNLGLGLARVIGYDAYVCLNNDVKLSLGFLEGIRQALACNPRIDVLGPLYDDVWPQQKGDYLEEARKYKPQPIEREVSFVDGTCMIITAKALEQFGLLDEEHFGQFGWGADIDYCYRVRLAGGVVAVTHRSYLNHIREGTAKKLVIDYKSAAGAELNAGMEKKYGSDWRELVY